MIIFLILILTGILVFAALQASSYQVPWARHLKRMHAGSATRAEWIAPDNVLQQVEEHYMEALYWLQDAAVNPPEHTTEAETYLCGNLLWRYRKQADYHTALPAIFTGILRADHAINVRQFSDDGKQCIVVDTRTEQRMASYDAGTHHRLLTQHVDEETLVYSMVYDVDAARWKLDAFVQALP
ncbi:MAG: hypothetical protein AAFR56_19070, partial [Chloroflexota bacterium]